MVRVLLRAEQPPGWFLVESTHSWLLSSLKFPEDPLGFPTRKKRSRCRDLFSFGNSDLQENVNSSLFLPIQSRSTGMLASVAHWKRCRLASNVDLIAVVSSFYDFE